MQKQCAECGAIVNENDKYCMVCGAALAQQGQTRQPQQNDKTIQTDTKPLSLGNYLLMFLIACIPIVNIIVLCIWAFGHKENQNRKNFAKAALIFVGIDMVVGIVIAVFLFQMILYGIICGLQKHELYEIYNNYEDSVPEEEWWYDMKVQDEAFSTMNSHIKQVLIEENGVMIL